MLRDILRRREKKWLIMNHYITYSRTFKAYFCEVCREEIENPVLHFWTKHHVIWIKARDYAMNLKRIDVDAS
jgi:hypothetical protein